MNIIFIVKILRINRYYVFTVYAGYSVNTPHKLNNRTYIKQIDTGGHKSKKRPNVKEMRVLFFKARFFASIRISSSIADKPPNDEQVLVISVFSTYYRDDDLRGRRHAKVLHASF